MTPEKRIWVLRRIGDLGKKRREAAKKKGF